MCRRCAVVNGGLQKPKLLRCQKPSLAMTHPQLIEEWDYEKNGDLMPEQFTAGSNVRVWWKCANCGQSWEATIAKRTRNRGTGCPYCIGKLPIPNETDLATLYPELATEWDDDRNGELTPEQVTAGSSKNVWWKCANCGQRWRATIVSRVRGNGCPYDAGKLPIPGKTDLATLRPDLAAEWDHERNGDLKPEQIVLGSHKSVWWKCAQCGQSWKAKVYSRTCLGGTGCPYDAGKIPIPGRNDLATLRSDLVAEWDYKRNGNLHPEQFVVGSERKVWWKCASCCQSWQATIASRTRPNGTGCPYCAGKLPIHGVTDLASVRSDLAVEWDYEANNGKRPEEYTVSSGKKVWWKCSVCGHRWEARIEARTRPNGTDCPYCSGRIPIPGETDLATKRPDLAEEWLYELNGDMVPQQFTVKSDKTVWWKCRECGGKQRQKISARANGERCICVSCRNRNK